MLNSKSGFFKFKFAGVWITVDALLPIAIAVICWVLAKRYFPSVVYLSNSNHYWILGGIGSLALSFSILFHELGHAFAARILRIPIERIHIYLFGGMAELRHRPLIPNQEFFVSMAGPIASGVLALISFVFISQIDASEKSILYFSVHFIAYMNLLLAAFNLIPVFPLDGGRAVRALMWKSQRNFYIASKTMHRFSSSLIAIIFVASLYLFFYYPGHYSFWLGIFGLYVAYLLMKAKSELTTLPNFTELVFKFSNESSPAQIIQKILEVNPDALKNSIIPVLVNQELHSIIYGKAAFDHLSDKIDFETLLEKPSLGTFIDSKDKQTFSNDLDYTAEFLPVFEHGKFAGLCDAYEMRFWLNETLYLEQK